MCVFVRRCAGVHADDPRGRVDRTHALKRLNIASGMPTLFLFREQMVYELTNGRYGWPISLQLILFLSKRVRLCCGWRYPARFHSAICFERRILDQKPWLCFSAPL